MGLTQRVRAYRRIRDSIQVNDVDGWANQELSAYPERVHRAKVLRAT